MKSDKQVSKEGRESYQQMADNIKKVVIVKLKAMPLCSSYLSAYPLSTIKRYDKNVHQKIEVSCPSIVHHYNAHMGGVDLADMLVALHRTNFKTHR